VTSKPSKNRIPFVLVAVGIVTGAVAGHTDEEVSPIYGVASGSRVAGGRRMNILLAW